MMAGRKKFIYSRTLWFNLLAAALSVLAEQTPLLRMYLADGGYLALTLFVAVGNAWLRTLTTTGVTLK